MLPEDRSAELGADVCGLPVASATSATRGQRKAQELAAVAAHMEEQGKQADVKQVDETGLLTC